MAWQTQIAIRSNKWRFNRIRFATKGEAERYGANLQERDKAVRDYRVIETDEPINFEFTEAGALRPLLIGRDHDD